MIFFPKFSTSVEAFFSPSLYSSCYPRNPPPCKSLTWRWRYQIPAMHCVQPHLALRQGAVAYAGSYWSSMLRYAQKTCSKDTKDDGRTATSKPDQYFESQFTPLDLKLSVKRGCRYCDLLQVTLQDYSSMQGLGTHLGVDSVYKWNSWTLGCGFLGPLAADFGVGDHGQNKYHQTLELFTTQTESAAHLGDTYHLRPLSQGVLNSSFSACSLRRRRTAEAPKTCAPAPRHPAGFTVSSGRLGRRSIFARSLNISITSGAYQASMIFARTIRFSPGGGHIKSGSSPDEPFISPKVNYSGNAIRPFGANATLLAPASALERVKGVSSPRHLRPCKARLEDT